MDKREIEFIHSNEAQGNHFKYNLKSPSTGKIGRNGSKTQLLGFTKQKPKRKPKRGSLFFPIKPFFFRL